MERDPDAPRGGYSGWSYCEALEEGLQPNYKPGEIFIHDNAPIHKSNLVQEWFESRGVWVVELPSYSPDLNPIKHMWWALKKMVHKLHPELKRIGNTKADWEALHKAIKEAWLKLPNSLIKKLILSMPQRLAAVRKARGAQTKY